MLFEAVAETQDEKMLQIVMIDGQIQPIRLKW
jgi:hypothetical protein